MSHFTVLVVGDEPEEQLAPYHEYECTGVNDEYVQDVDITQEIQARIDTGKSLREALEYFGLEKKIVLNEEDIDIEGDDAPHRFGYAIIKGNKLIKAIDRTNPNAKWDWYQLGGRWTGFFYIKNGAEPLLGKKGLMTPDAEPGTADACYKRDIDFDRMREFARVKAELEYAHFETVTGGMPVPESWDSVLKRIGHKNIKEAREFYSSQPMVIAMHKDEQMMFDDPEQYEGGRDKYVARAVRNCISTHAVVKSGKWYEKGSMGWWGMVIDEKEPDRWSEEFAKLIEGVSDDTLLSVYDCHI